MPEDYTESGMHVNRIRYAKSLTISGMPRSNLKNILWINVLACMKHKYGKENLNAFARDAKFSPGNATRIKEQRTEIGLDLLQKAAAAFDLQAFQLLIPDLNPSNPPVFMLSETELKLYKRLKRAHDELIKEED